MGDEASCKALENAGMTLEDVARRKFYLHGVFRDMRVHPIIRDDLVNEQEYRRSREFQWVMKRSG